jgi:hypothetical protein
VTGAPTNCGAGLLFDVLLQGCNWAADVECVPNSCVPTAAPTSAPTSTPRPTSGPTDSLAPTIIASQSPTNAPSDEVINCCPDDTVTGFRAYDDCTRFYQCMNGVAGPMFSCAPGLLFDESSQICNWESDVLICRVDSCGPTVTPTFAPSLPTTSPRPSPSPLETPSLTPTVYISQPPSFVQSAAPSSAPSWSSSPTALATTAPTLSPQCCPPGFSGLRSYDDCSE